MYRHILPLLLVAFFSVALLGCGGGSLGEVKGKVEINGQPVSGGRITFAPVGDGSLEAGKPASGDVQSDGTFALTTYDKDDGALVGKHRVTYIPPVLDEDKTPNPDHQALQRYHVPPDFTVEVQSGTNEITIKLQRKSRADAL